MEAHRYGLSAAALKYLAALFMLVDHIGMVFPTMLTELGLPTWADGLPRLIGRLAFPIFAYFVAAGCRRTEPSMAMSVCPKQSTAQPCRPFPCSRPVRWHSCSTWTTASPPCS